MKITLTEHFKTDVDFYIRKKRYMKINDDIKPILFDLSNGNIVGDKLDNIKVPDNGAVYKVRVANSSANVGKSNGFRIIYYLEVADEIYLLTIYSKKDGGRTGIPNDKQIELLVKNILME